MTTKSHLIFIEWRDTAGLHVDTANSILDIKFLKDELRFLKDLVAAHTLELIYGKSTEESKAVITQLKGYSKRVKKLLKALRTHSNNLRVLLDDDVVPGEMQSYKDEHYKLMVEEMDLHADLKKTKLIIFKMLAEIMNKNKQKEIILIDSYLKYSNVLTQNIIKAPDTTLSQNTNYENFTYLFYNRRLFSFNAGMQQY